MKVFVSSLISGMEDERAAVKRSILALGHEPVMAEDFGATASSPQIACLNGLRGSDVVVLILGPRYGGVQASGLSAAHEEYREANGKKPVLVFLQAVVDLDIEQAKFVEETGGWQSGLFRVAYSSAEQLGDAVTRALHDWQLAHAVAPLDPAELAQRSLRLLPSSQQHGMRMESALLLSIAGGPAQSILRPSELESASLAESMEQEAMFGSSRIFDKNMGSHNGMEEGWLIVRQTDQRGYKNEARLSESGEMVLRLSMADKKQSSLLPVIVEERVLERIAVALGYGAWLLERIDSTHRLSHIALAARLTAVGSLAWRTESEQLASPNSVSMHAWGTDETSRDIPIQLSPPHIVRAALTMNRDRIAEDLMVLMRRRWR